ESLEPLPPVLERKLGQQLAIGIRQEIEDDQQRRRLLGKLGDAARRRVDALEQIVERKDAIARHHDLAVEDEAFERQLARGFNQIGKIAGERLAGFRLQVDLVAV